MGSVKNSVPYFSQRSADVPHEWRPRSCGVVALRMALAGTASGTPPSTAELIEEGLAAGAYIPGTGWKHVGLVKLAKRYGAEAYRKEFKSKVAGSMFGGLLLRIGMLELKQAVRRGTVPIVSLAVPESSDTHLVPLTGFTKQGFLYHEPAADGEGESGAYREVAFGDFKRRWRRLVIFISKPA